MNVVYVVLVGFAYEGLDIKAVFDSKAKAEAYVAKNLTTKYRDESARTYYDCVRIKAWGVI